SLSTLATGTSLPALTAFPTRHGRVAQWLAIWWVLRGQMLRLLKDKSLDHEFVPGLLTATGGLGCCAHGTSRERGG
ncbi:MAG TPA: hypothetical protein VMV81_14520, partial [Phycisphaerae bacterium]|nr:hypothetical protein [Phycisphaerae bacterium]